MTDFGVLTDIIRFLQSDDYKSRPYYGLPGDNHPGDENLASIQLYVSHGAPPGSFLEAVISNDLKEAVAIADEKNRQRLPGLVVYIVNCTPSGCQGSPEIYKAWMAAHAEVREAEPHTEEEPA